MCSDYSSTFNYKNRDNYIAVTLIFISFFYVSAF